MTLAIAPQLSLPLSAVTETLGILAVKRAGKSNAAVVLAEEMYDAGLPWVAIDPKGDWWGVRAAGDGKAPGLSVVVFGGLHGDVPLEPGAGRLVAELVAEQRLTCVLDVSEMSRADQRRFLTDFATRLYQRNREPLHVFCEEADEYIPQRVMGEAAKMVGAFETLVKRGGFRGIGITLITQRSASLNKDVLSQVGTLVAMRTPGAHDRKAISAWVDFHGAAAAMVSDLPTLSAGEAFVFSPEWLPREGMEDLHRVRFRKRRTFDSGATPEVGKRQRQAPSLLADVDLAAIKEQMVEAIERAEADDPKLLRKRIAELERQLRDRPEPEPPEPIIREVPVISPETLARMEELLAPHAELLEQLSGCLAAFREVPAPPAPPPKPSPRRLPAAASPAEVGAAVGGAAARELLPRASADGAGLGKSPRRILGVLIQQGPLTKRKLAVRVGMSANGGSFNRYLSTLSSEGLIIRGVQIEASAAGTEAMAGLIEPLPEPGPELFAWWCEQKQVGRSPRRILEALRDHGALTKRDLAEAVEMEASGGSFNRYLSTLRSLDLIEGTTLISLAEDLQ